MATLEAHMLRDQATLDCVPPGNWEWWDSLTPEKRAVLRDEAEKLYDQAGRVDQEAGVWSLS